MPPPSRRRFTSAAAAGLAAIGAAGVTGVTGIAGLAGCSTGGSRSGAAGGPLSYWAGASPSGVSAHRAYLTPLLAGFTRQTGIAVALRVSSWQSLFADLARGIVDGTGPDVAEIRAGWSVTLQATGGLSEVTADILHSLGGRKRFLDASWHTAGAGGRPASSVPVRSSVRILLHDRAALAAAGLPGAPATWDELEYVRPLLARGGRHALSWAGADLDALVEDLTVLTRQAGGELLAGENPHFIGPPVPWALNLRLALGSAGWAAPAEAGVSDPAAPARAVMARRAVAALVDSSALGLVLAAPAAVRQRVAFAPIPSLGRSPYAPHGLLLRSLTGGTNLVVPRSSPRAGAGWQLVAHLTDDVRQSQLDPATGTLPVVASAWRSRTSAAAAMLHGILTLGSLPTPATVHARELRATLGAMVHGLLAERPGTVPTAARQLAALRSTQVTFDALP